MKKGHGPAAWHPPVALDSKRVVDVFNASLVGLVVEKDRGLLVAAIVCHFYAPVMQSTEWVNVLAPFVEYEIGAW